MSDTKALYDVVADALAGQGREAQDAFEALMKQLRGADALLATGLMDAVNRIDAEMRDRAQRAEADNAALLEAVNTYHEAWKTGRDGVPFAALLRTAHKPHPGAALLEEVEGLRNRVKEVENDLRRSVAARLEQQTTHNAALEEAAKEFRYAVPTMLRSDVVQELIRALKKTGQGA